MNAPARSEKTKALCVATRCTSTAQFIETFQRFCDDSSFFVATLTMRPVGLETPFAIQLADRSPVLRGVCVVLDAWSTGDNKFKRPGIRLGIKRLTPDSAATYAKLREAALATALSEPPPADEPPPPPPRSRTDSDPMSMHTAITKEGPDGDSLSREADQLGRAPAVAPQLSIVPPPPATPRAIPRVVSGPTDAERWLANRTPAPASPAAIERSGSTHARHDRSTVALPQDDEPLIIIESDATPVPTQVADVVAKTVVEQAHKPVVIEPARRREAARAAEVPRRTHHPKIAPPPAEPDSLESVPTPIVREPTSALPVALRPPALPLRSALPVAKVPAPSQTLPIPMRTKPAAPPKAPLRTVTTPPASKPAVGVTGAPTAFAISVVPPPAAPLDLTPMTATGPTGEIPPAGSDGRIPGSELILPANPLMNLTDESIGGFIDCTLYEDGSNFVAPPEDEEASAIDPLVGAPLLAPRARGNSVPPRGARPTTIPPPLSTDTPVALVPVDSFGRPTTIPPWMAMPPPTAPPAASAPPATVKHPTIPPPIAAPVAPPLPVIVPAPSTAPRPRDRRWLVAAAAVIVVGAGGAFAARSLLTSDDDVPPAVAAAPVPVPVVAPVDAAVVAEPAPPPPEEAVDKPAPPTKAKPPKPPKPVDEPDDEPEDDEGETTADGTPIVGEGPCLLNVTSTPAGSTVIVDGRSVGPSPLTVAGPCTRRKVDVAHPRYKLGTQWVNLVADKPSSVDIRLARPTHTLNITTFPIGATISIGGRRAGTSPAIVQVMGFSNVTIKIEKPGFKPTAQKVYTKDPQGKLFVRLTR